MKYIFAFLIGVALLVAGIFVGLHAPSCPYFQKLFPAACCDNGGGCNCGPGCCGCAANCPKDGKCKPGDACSPCCPKAGNCCSGKCAANCPKGGKCTPEDNCSPCCPQAKKK